MTAPKRLSARLSVSPQVDPSEMRTLAEAGFRSIISNRPDGEEPRQPDWAQLSEAAHGAGLKARHIPVVGGSIGDDDVTRFRAALDELPGPVLAFCRTGTRSATLWALSKAGTLTPDEIVGIAADAGYDLSQLRERLTKNRGARS